MGDTWASIRAAGNRARDTAVEVRVRRALARSGWSLARAARALAVDVETLSRYLARRHPDLYEERRWRVKRRR